MSERPRDLAFEALVRVTHANPAMERGNLNKALAAIKEASRIDGLHPDSLPDEIERRARMWRESPQWGHLTLTPTALAKHWYRVLVEPPQQQQRSRQQEELRKLREGDA